MNELYLDKEFEKFWTKLSNKENFTFLRYGDGERAIMCGKKIRAQEGWESTNYISKLGRDLLNTLNIEDENVYYGISCPCCDKASYYWYCTRIKNKNKTFANLWVNANYKRFYSNFLNLKQDAILIANYRAENYKIGNLNILKHYKIGDDCISFWENEALNIIQKIKEDYGTKNNLLYIVSAGPMSETIIAELYKNNPNNCYIDFGSSIDTFIHKKQTRPYMDDTTIYAKQNCIMDDPKTTNFNVSVVLNLYKRPENLALQLEALEKQTLKPKEILLYQDGTGNIIKIPENIKDKFDFIEINPENRGVWARFDFAKRVAKSKYICIFDDDTIPGSRWLENCHTEMLKQEGLYGTIGIILKNPTDYPNKCGFSYFRAGWDGNYNQTIEVDFAGHSWFFKKEWLDILFNAPKEIQNLKVAGEDMAFSYQLLKIGIKTFIPPHPKNNKELFGSIPETALKLGTNKVAVSMNPDNLKIMKKGIKILLNQGWKPLIKRKPSYVKKIEQKLGYCKYIFFGLIRKQKTNKHRVITLFNKITIKFKRKK